MMEMGFEKILWQVRVQLFSYICSKAQLSEVTDGFPASVTKISQSSKKLHNGLSSLHVIAFLLCY